MSNSQKSAQMQRLNLLAAQYQRQGYDVTISPSTEQLPSFLQAFQPALLLHKDNQMTVVAIADRTVQNVDRQIPEMARVLNQQAGWNFELVVTEAPQDSFDFGSTFNEEEVQQRLEQARELLKSSLFDASLLVAWSAAEAALRKIGYQEDIFPRYQTAIPLIKALTVEGVISRTEHDLLVEAARIQNAAAHGYRVEENRQLVQSLIAAAENLLQLEPTADLVPA